MIKKTVLCVSLFVLSLLLFALVTMPAKFVWQKMVEPQLDLRRTGLELVAIEGSVWNGSALINKGGVEFIIDWSVLPSGMINALIPIQLLVKSHAGTVKSLVSLGLSGSSFELELADLDLQHLTPLLKRQRIELSGKLRVENLVVDLEDRRIVSANGNFSWSGGEISYPAARQIHKRDLPAFKGVVESGSNGLIELGIRDAASRFDLIEGTLEQDGTALLKVKRRLLDIADEAWPKNSNEQDVVFKVKKVIY